MGFELQQYPSSLEIVNKFIKRMRNATKEAKSDIKGPRRYDEILQPIKDPSLYFQA